MSLTAVISAFRTGTYSVARPAAGTYTNGVFTPGADSTFSMDASEQPLTGRDLKAHAEGRRAEDVRGYWTRTELRVGDKITSGGEVYEVFRVFTHGILGPTFYRAMAARQAIP